MKKSKAVVFLVLAVVILAGIAGIFYYKYKNPEITKLVPPKLFSKGDYVVEDRADGQYIVVNKVGLTAKVPPTWRVEFEGNDLPDGTSQYWVNLLSEDATTGASYLKKGCKISIATTNSEEYNKELKDKIIKIQNNETIESYGIVKIIENKIIKINNNDALIWLSDIHEIAGQFAGLSIPIGSKIVLETNASFAKNFSQQCLPIWEDFVKNIVIK